ncbi:hypothetical protein LJR231_002291 [Phyllobacterium sp. LjRoot231]|uniref:hypothetical protein n=1 Tax=Phyllobacterium sp. LjRoot231 TaxID=3342289 RepID=UPI003ED0ACF2
MSLQENSKTGKRSVAPLLISIFWLVSTISAALGTVYMTGSETSIAAKDARTPTRNETRLAHEADNQPTPAQRPMRVAALEALHLKIKSGLRSDSGPENALVPAEPALVIVNWKSVISAESGSSLALDRNSVFSARAPPLAVA